MLNIIIGLYKKIPKRVLYIIIYIIYIQILLNILGSPIHCMDSDSYINDKEVIEDSKDPQLYNKEELKNDIVAISSGIKTISKGMTVAATGAAALDLVTGDPEFVNKGSIALGSAAITIATDIGEKALIRGIEKMDEEISISRPQSPSIYDSDNVYKNSIIDIEGIVEWFNGLEDKEKLIVCSLILVGCSLNLYITMRIKNNINTIINRKISNNKKYRKIISIKDSINKYTNIIVKVIISIFIIYAILIVLFIIVWY